MAELHIGGHGLARGYLNRPELTAEKFIDNPFATEEDKKFGHNLRLYKTGDLARWLPDGNLEFIGRIDDQVKIRGFRIELGEIESVLSTHSDVSQCVVLAKGEGQDKKLVAYVVSQYDKGINQASIRTYLKDQLPDYMIPSFFIPLDSLPLNRNGKIDRKALPEPDESGLIRDNAYVAPRTESERILCDIFQSVLKLEQVGIHDNFFHIGGNSLSSIKLSAIISEKFNDKISVKEIFDYPTPLLLSYALTISYEKKVNDYEETFLPLEKKQELLESSIQVRCYSNEENLIASVGSVDAVAVGYMSDEMYSFIENHQLFNDKIGKRPFTNINMPRGKVFDWRCAITTFAKYAVYAKDSIDFSVRASH